MLLTLVLTASIDCQPWEYPEHGECLRLDVYECQHYERREGNTSCTVVDDQVCDLGSGQLYLCTDGLDRPEPDPVVCTWWLYGELGALTELTQADVAERCWSE